MMELIDNLDLKHSEKASVLSKKANYKEQQLNEECPKCQTIISPDHSLQDHMFLVHYRKSEKTFASLPKLEKHIRIDHAPDQLNLPCKKCNFVFQTNSAFDNHLSGHEHNQVKNTIIECVESDDEYSADEFYIDTCNYCGLIWNLFDELDHHTSNLLHYESSKVCFHNEF